MTGEDTPHRRSLLFTVRIWADPAADPPADRWQRGSVHDVATGGFRNFRDWADLTSFLTDRIEEALPMNEETS